MPGPFEAAEQSAGELRRRLGRDRWDVALVMGTGWQQTAEALGPIAASAAYTDLPGFGAATAEGHRSVVHSIGDTLVFAGRHHLYEGHGPSGVAHLVRTAAAAGCRTAILTNAAGGLRPDWPVGQPVLISDHLNLTGLSPLTGPPPPGGRFIDLTHAYSPRLRRLAHSVDPSLPEGVYAGLPGPHFETPAEIRMLRTVGADLVGMSTVLEAIAAVHAGMEVLGISLVTNLAAGMTDEKVSSEDVARAAGAAAPRMGALLRGVLEALAASPS